MPPLESFSEEKRRATFRFDIDVEGTWEKIRVPVLVAWCEGDRLVPAKKSQEIIAAALERGGNTKATLQIFEGGTHSLTWAVGPRDPWQRLRVVPEWTDLLCSWLEENVVNAP